MILLDHGRGSLPTPIPLALEGVGRQRYATATLARVDAAPVDLRAGEPKAADRVQRGFRMMTVTSELGAMRRQLAEDLAVARSERPSEDESIY